MKDEHPKTRCRTWRRTCHRTRRRTWPSGPRRRARSSPRHRRRRRRRHRLCAALALRWGRTGWAAQWHLARAVGRRFRGCRAKRFYVHMFISGVSARLDLQRGDEVSLRRRGRFTKMTVARRASKSKGAKRYLCWKMVESSGVCRMGRRCTMVGDFNGA